MQSSSLQRDIVSRVTFILLFFLSVHFITKYNKTEFHSECFKEKKQIFSDSKHLVKYKVIEHLYKYQSETQSGCKNFKNPFKDSIVFAYLLKNCHRIFIYTIKVKVNFICYYFFLHSPYSED